MIKIKKIITRAVYVLFLLSLVLSGGAVAAENNIRESAYLEDSAGKLSVEQVQQAVFTPYSHILSKGYSESVFWVRLKVAPNLTGKPWVLRMQPTYLDDIEVYQRQHGLWVKKVAGDKHAFADREIHQTSFGVYVAPDDRESEIYVRLKTTSTHLIGFELVDQQQFLRLEGLRDLILSIFLGINVVLLLWLLMQNSLQKDVLLVQLGLFLLVEFIYLSFILGFVSRYILPNDPELANYLTSVFVILIVFFGALFHRTFMAAEMPVKAMQIAFNLIFALSLVPMLLFLTGAHSRALMINGLLVLLMAILAMTTLIVHLVNKNLFSRFFAIGYFVLGILILIGTAPIIGIIKANSLSLYANIYSGMISSMMLLMLLRDRQYQKNLASNAAIESERIVQIELALEKERRELQGKLMSMLTHELRTPLYLLRLVIDGMSSRNKLAGQADQAVRDMYMIIERCQQMDRFDGLSKDALEVTDFNPVAVIHELLSQHPVSGRFVSTISNTQFLQSDLVLFKIIFGNLIENAIKYSAAGSDILLSVSSKTVNHKNYWHFSIINHVGKAGIPDSKRIFDKYYRSPGAHNISGSGLGLFLVKSLTELIGGFVKYKVVGDQIGFEICLPQ
jgi:signal transduction histidine kinase